MGRIVFKPIEVQNLTKAVKIEVPEPILPEIDEEEEEIYTGPSIEEVEAEIERMRRDARIEADEIINNANEKAKEIINDAENSAFLKIKNATEKVKVAEEEARRNAEQIIEEANNQAKTIVSEAEFKKDSIIRAAEEEGYKEGVRRGLEDGKAEIVRLVSRLGSIISEAINKRTEIIASAEKQIMELVLLIVRKVIKDEAKYRKDVVLNTIRAALKQIQNKEEVIIRVNLADLEVSTDHKEEFINQVESLKNVKIYEDARVDRGGCIIEMDFGLIDARIQKQLEEIETQIRDINL